MNAVLYVTDRGYLGPTLASLLSVREVWPRDLPLQAVVGFDGFLDTHESRELQHWAGQHSIELSIVPIGEWLDGMDLPMGTRLDKRHSRTVWAILWLSEIVGELASKVLYMDGDCMAVRDPSGLFMEDLSGCVVGAVRDDPVPTVSAEFGLPGWRSLGMNAEDPYFNSGVLVVDVDAWRDARVGDSARKILRDYRGIPEQYDQEILNIALWNRWRELDTSWNTASWWFRPERTALERETALSNAAIMHFSGSTKPWTRDALDHHYSHKFRQHLSHAKESLPFGFVK